MCVYGRFEFLQSWSLTLAPLPSKSWGTHAASRTHLSRDFIQRVCMMWHTACTPLPSAGLNLLVHLYLFLLPRMHTILHCNNLLSSLVALGLVKCTVLGISSWLDNSSVLPTKQFGRHFICMSFSFFLAETKTLHSLTLFSVVSYNKIAVSCCVLIVTVKLPQKKNITLPASNFAETCTALGFFHVRSHEFMSYRCALLHGSCLAQVFYVEWN